MQQKTKEIWKVFQLFQNTHLCQSIYCNHCYFLQHCWQKIIFYLCLPANVRSRLLPAGISDRKSITVPQENMKMSKSVLIEICVCISVDIRKVYTAFSKSTSWIWELFSQEEEMWHEKQVTSHTKRAADGASMKQFSPPRAWHVLQAGMDLPH